MDCYFTQVRTVTIWEGDEGKKVQGRGTQVRGGRALDGYKYDDREGDLIMRVILVFSE